jgi:hypothetical protein
MDPGLEWPQDDGQLARRMVTESLGRFNLTSTNEKLNRNIHEDLLRPFTLFLAHKWWRQCGLASGPNESSSHGHLQDSTRDQ